MNFRQLRKLITPRWLSEGDGELVGYALDLLKDAFAERARLGHLARFPENGPNGETAPADALTALGRDRRMVRGINESASVYAARLKDWLTDRRRAGNPFVLMKQLAAYTGDTGCSFRTVDVRGNWYSRAADGTETSSVNTGNWDWDGDTDRWSRFWVIIYPGTLWTDGGEEWGSGDLWGSAGSLWGTDITPEQATNLRAIIADWKPAGTYRENIIVAFDPSSFDPTSPEPDGNWAHWSKLVAGVRVPARLDTARYLDGV